MDKKEYETYEEVHEKLAAAMQEACLYDEAGPYQEPSDDLSFLFEKPEEKKRKKFSVGRFGKIAAIVIMVLLSMNIVMISMQSNVSYSEKGLLHRIYEGARGIFTDDPGDKFVKQDETRKVYITDNLNNIDEAKAFWSGLYVPQYVPEGYMLDSLEISSDITGSYSALYKFAYNTNTFYIMVFECQDNDTRITSNNTGEFLEYPDRTLHIYENSVKQYLVSDVYFDDIIASVYGEIPKNEIVNISLNLY